MDQDVHGLKTDPVRINWSGLTRTRLSEAQILHQTDLQVQGLKTSDPVLDLGSNTSGEGLAAQSFLAEATGVPG